MNILIRGGFLHPNCSQLLTIFDETFFSVEMVGRNCLEYQQQMPFFFLKTDEVRATNLCYKKLYLFSIVEEELQLKTNP